MNRTEEIRRLLHTASDGTGEAQEMAAYHLRVGGVKNAAHLLAEVDRLSDTLGDMAEQRDTLRRRLDIAHKVMGDRAKRIKELAAEVDRLEGQIAAVRRLAGAWEGQGEDWVYEGYISPDREQGACEALICAANAVLLALATTPEPEGGEG